MSVSLLWKDVGPRIVSCIYLYRLALFCDKLILDTTVTKPRLEWLTVLGGLISDQWCNCLHCLHQSGSSPEKCSFRDRIACKA